MARVNFHGDTPTADIASVISAPLPEYPTKAAIRIETIRLWYKTFIFKATVQLASSAPAKTTITTPMNAIEDLPSGSAPNKGIAGILFNLKDNGETKVPDPTAKPTPEKYPSVATIAFGMYKILRRSNRSPPKIPGCKTVVKFFTIEIFTSSNKPKMIDEIPSKKAIIREPYKKPWPNATFRPTVAPIKSVNGKT